MTGKGVHSGRSRGRARRRGRSGLTLVEVLLAIVLLGVGLFGVANLYGRQVRYVKRAQWEAQAQSLAQAYLARVAGMGYEALASKIQLLGDSPTASSARLSSGAGLPAVQEGFQWNVVLTKVAGASPGLIEVRVQIAPSETERGRIESMGMRLQAARKEAVTYVVAQ